MKFSAFLAMAVLCLGRALGADQKPITVATGQEFKITLESNSASGNQWLVAKPLDDRMLKFLSSEYKRGRPGAGQESLSFKALGEGRTEISLKYGRLWEKETEPARMTNFVVVITRTAAASH